MISNGIAIDGIIFSLQQSGGVSTYFNNLLNFLGSTQEDVSFLIENPLLQNLAVNNNIFIHSRRARLLERYRCCRQVKKSGVFHSSYYRTSCYKDVPTVVTVHDFIYERYSLGLKKWVHSIQKNNAIRNADAIICVSESTKNDLLNYVGINSNQSIHVIHNGVSDSFCYLNLQQPDRPYILFVGQRAGYKNFRLVLDALIFIHDIDLVCVGGGAIHPKELTGVATSVASRVNHLGYVSDESLNYLYNKAICLVYPSLYEGFGIPVLEAMRSGCPVVSVSCKAVIEIGQDALILAQEIHSQSIAQAIFKTMSSDRMDIIRRCLAVGNKYSWKETHKKTLETYSEISK